MPSVYSEAGSIGWNNSVPGDNVPQPAGSRAHWDSLTQEPRRDCNCNHSYSDDATTYAVTPPPSPSLPPPPPTGDCFPAASMLLHPLICFSSPLTLISLLITALPLQSFHSHPRPPAWADCQCLQVILGCFPFITLSKSGMALALGGIGLALNISICSGLC